MDVKQELSDRLKCLIEAKEKEIDKILHDYIVTRADDGGKSNVDKRIKQYLRAKTIDGLSTKTIRNYTYILDIFAGQISKAVTKITTDDIREYIIYLADERHLKESSLLTQINTLRSFFSWMLDEEIIKKNPMKKIKTARMGKKGNRQGLTIEELERIREACETYREKALIEFLVSSGCRIGEVVNLDLDNIDWRDRNVMVNGKGGKVRTVYFSFRARLMSEEHIRQRKGGTSLFVSSKKPYESLSVRAMQKIIQKISERAGLSRKVHPHLLRHTFAELALNAGMDVTVIQKLLGHEDPATTQIYAKYKQEMVRQQYDRYVA